MKENLKFLALLKLKISVLQKALGTEWKEKPKTEKNICKTQFEDVLAEILKTPENSTVRKQLPFKNEEKTCKAKETVQIWQNACTQIHVSLENFIVKQHRDNPTHLLGELKSKMLTTQKAVKDSE